MDDLGVTFYDYMQVIHRRIVPFLVVLILFPLIAYFFTPEDEQKYRSFVQVEFEAPRSHQPLFQEIGNTFRRETSVATQMEIIRSEAVAHRVVRHMLHRQIEQSKLKGPSIIWPELYNEHRAAQRLKEDLYISAIPNTSIIQIGVISDTPEKAERLANAMGRVYVDYSTELLHERMSSALEFIGEQLEKLRQERISEEKVLWEYKSENRFATVGAGIERLSNLESLLVNTMIERQIEETRLEEIRRLVAEQKQEVLPEVAMYKSPLVERLREKLAELDFERALLLRDFTQSHPEVEELSEEIQRTQEVLTEEVKELMKSDLPILDPLSTYRNLVDEMINLQVGINAKKRREKVLAKSIDHYLGQLEELSNAEIDISRLTYKIEMKKNTYERFLQKKEQVELSMAMETGQVHMIQDAFGTRDETGNKKMFTMAWSLLGGLAGAVGLAFILDMNDRRIKNQNEVKRFLGLPLMGMVPRIRMPIRGAVTETIAHYEEGTPFAEAFRKLRTQIEFKSIEQPIRTLMCTSTRQEEGKTTLITNLGISFAQKGERVLIIDCDLRRPALHRAFGTRRSPGLSDVLVEEVPWKQVVQETDIPNLYIITSGERPRNPSELLGSARMRVVVEQWKQQFDRVLFDISSVLAVTDSAVMAPMCEGVILTVKAMEVPRDYIMQAVEILQGVGANILGVALNGVKISRRSYYYYYYYSPTPGTESYAE